MEERHIGFHDDRHVVRLSAVRDGPAGLFSKVLRGVSDRVLEEVAEGELIAVTELLCNLCDGCIRIVQQSPGFSKLQTFAVGRKRFAHHSLKKLRRVFLTIAKKLGQTFQAHSSAEVGVDKSLEGVLHAVRVPFLLCRLLDGYRFELRVSR